MSPYRGKHRRTTADEEGQVAQVAAISGEDATGDHVDGESDRAEEGLAGPDARVGD